MGIKVNLPSLKVRSWLILGFGLLAVILVVTVAVDLRQIKANGTLTEIMVAQRLPSTMTGTRLVANVQASTAALRDWMLTGNPAFKAMRTSLWDEVDQDRQQLDALAKDWEQAQDKTDWGQAKTLLDKLRAAQQDAETIAHSDQEQPALALLAKDAKTPEAVVTGSLGAMLNEELTQPASDDTKALIVGRLPRSVER
jgi:methyl-accepting chemotaxis protein